MRKFLVVLDNSTECLNAMRFAAMRAAHTGGGVTILAIIPPEEFNHWLGVGEVMREEARERIHAHFEVFAKWMRDKQGVDPELAGAAGDPAQPCLGDAAGPDHAGARAPQQGTAGGHHLSARGPRHCPP